MSGSGPPLWAPASSSQQRLFRKSSTYLAKIAVVLQRAPEKMLTFPQVRRPAPEASVSVRNGFQEKKLPLTFSCLCCS